MRQNLASQLQSFLDVEVAMMRTWLAGHENNAESVASDIDVRRLTAELLATRAGESSDVDAESIAEQLARQIGPAMHSHDYDTYIVATRSEIVASTRPDAVGLTIPAEFDRIFNRVFEGAATVTPPFISVLPQVDSDGKMRTGVPSMYVLAPVLDEDLQVIAAPGLADSTGARVYAKPSAGPPGRIG